MNVDHAAFEGHQSRALQLLRAVVDRLEDGMSAPDVAQVARSMRPEHGFTHWFHKPRIDIGALRSPFPNPLRSPKVLRRGDLIHIDLAPATPRGFGDVGCTWAFESTEPGIVSAGRELTQAICGYASHWKCVGELVVFARSWCRSRQLTLHDRGGLGHDCLGPDRAPFGPYPASARAAILLRRHRVHMLNPRRMNGCYAIQVAVSDQTGFASFEEMVYVSPDGRVVLGRDNQLEGVGRLA